MKETADVKYIQNAETLIKNNLQELEMAEEKKDKLFEDAIREVKNDDENNLAE